jgi:hypothetical protein
MEITKTNIFINKAKLIHGNRFDYSISNYIGARENIKIICLIHGEFEQRVTNHLNGRGCPICSGNMVKNNNEIINEFRRIHVNKYDYSQVIYVNNHTKVNIICDIHGLFKQRPNDHLNGKGCPKCGLISRTLKRKETNFGFITKANLLHNSVYIYSQVDYNNSGSKVKIICPKHGIFEQTPDNHLKGKGCPICKESKGEKQIREYLLKNDVEFVTQKRFKDCIYKYTLPFDFYLPELNTCIEYQGIQHYKPISVFGGELAFKETNKRDLIKNNYCDSNNINLILIKYDENINDKLINLL